MKKSSEKLNKINKKQVKIISEKDEYQKEFDEIEIKIANS
jgi:hypothetical protein